MNIGIIGGGAIGLLVASKFSLLHHDVTIYVKRQNQKDAINHRGLTLYRSKAKCKVTAKLIEDIKVEDVLFVCTKQYQLKGVMEYLHHTSCPIIFMQNGMGHVDMIEGHLKQELLVATCEHGAVRKDDTTVHHRGEGKINIASFHSNNGKVVKLHSLLHDPSFPIVLEEDWYIMLARKLIANVVINPITGIFQVKNGELLANPNLEELANKICQEAARVLGLNPEDEWNSVIDIIRGTKDNESSMKLDIAYKRKTEIEAMTGYIIDRATNEIPFVHFIDRAIKAIEWQAGG